MFYGLLGGSGVWEPEAGRRDVYVHIFRLWNLDFGAREAVFESEGKRSHS